MNPLSEHYHFATFGYLLATQYVDMSEDKKVYFRALRMVFLAKLAKVAKKEVVGYSPALPLHATVAAPVVGKGHRPSRMNGTECALAKLVAEKRAKKAERCLLPPYSVTMGKIERLPAKPLYNRTVYNLYAEFRRQIVVDPYIVVALHPYYPYARIGKLGKLAEKAHKSFRHHVAVFIPIVEYVAKKVYGVGIMLDAVEKGNNPPLRLSRIGEIGGAEVKVA